MKFLLFFLFVAFAVATPVANPNFITDLIIDCGTNGKIDYFEIDNCFTFPCFFSPQNHYSYEIEFTTAQDSSLVHLMVNALWNGMEMTFIDEEAGMNLEANTKYSLQYTLQVPNVIIGEIDLKFILIDKSEDHKIICGIVEGVLCGFC